MPSSRKINLEKVRASLDAVCPKCSRVIPPTEVRRVNFERIESSGSDLIALDYACKTSNDPARQHLEPKPQP
jgi:hypothetical protein